MAHPLSVPDTTEILLFTVMNWSCLTGTTQIQTILLNSELRRHGSERVFEGHLRLSVHGLESLSKAGFWNYVRFQEDYIERIMDLFYGVSSVASLVKLKYALDLCQCRILDLINSQSSRSNSRNRKRISRLGLNHLARTKLGFQGADYGHCSSVYLPLIVSDLHLS